ncbi:ankyrin-2-like [Lineus longissimus]|uniref:ankyrin-2-like n=1 Tax=Lineus longissimus TaxID=88925 RepID=UPI00315D591A
MESLHNSEDYDIAVSKACLSGNIEELKLLIEHGADINVRDRSRFITRFKGFSVPVLFNAVEQQHVDVVKLLLKHRASVHNLDKFGRSALHIACAVGNSVIVQLLLDYGANVNLGNANRKCPIHVASTCGHTQIVKLLLGYDSVVNVNDMQGSTPLYCAVENGHTDVVDVLLSYGAVIHMDIETFNHSPLLIGYQNFHLGAVKCLLAQPDKLRNEEIGQIVSKLHFSAFLGDIDTLLTLLDSECDINSQDVMGRTLLHIACKIANMKLVYLCLTKGIDVNIEDNKGMSALYYLCEGKCKSFHSLQHVDEMLVENSSGFCVHETDSDQVNSESCQTKIAKFLLDNGTKIHGVDSELSRVGWTPICHACYNGNLSLIKLLIGRTCTADIDNGTERFPLHTAISSHNPEVVKLLVESEANVNMFGSNFDKSFSPLHLAVHFGLEDVTSVLLEAGADPNLREGNTNSTPLSFIQKKSVPICKLLLAKGANPNVANKFGNTALHDACRLMWEDNDLVKSLVEGGADVNLVNKHGRVPLHNACEKSHSKIVMTLLKAGAETYVRDTKDDTPLMMLLNNYLALGKLSSSVVISAMLPLLNASCPWYLWDNENSKSRKLLMHLYAYCRHILKVLIPFGCGSSVHISPHRDILLTLCGNKDYEILSMMMECGYNISETELVEFYSDTPSNQPLIQSLRNLFYCKSLQSFCRLTVRRRIFSSFKRGDFLNTQIQCLPIPGKLKEFILLKQFV